MLLLLATLVAGYLVICGYVYVDQRKAMYFPQFTRSDPVQTNFRVESGGLVLHGWVVNPGRRDAVLYFGGNAESVEYNRAEFSRWLPDRSVYLVPYRGYGANDGEPTEEHLYADALALYDVVRERHPEGAIAAIGRSLGSGVAAYLASQQAVEKLVLVTPFDSLAAVGQAHYPWLPVRWLAKDHYDSARYLSDYTKPVLVIRAGQDRVIPPERTDALIAALPEPPEVVQLRGGHNDIGDSDAYYRGLMQFLTNNSSVSR